ncbi:MAG: dihydrofolate reductase [Balneolales bacterium]
MIISLIAAHDPNLVIGIEGKLPWNIPEDMRHFRQRTTGNVVVMGRGVFEELGEQPLPKRRNLVLSRSKVYSQVETCRSREEVLEKVKNEKKIYIIGGAQIYQLFLPVSNRLEITVIHKEYVGDTFFPEYRNEIGTIWREVSKTEFKLFTFRDYDRIR